MRSRRRSTAGSQCQVSLARRLTQSPTSPASFATWFWTYAIVTGPSCTTCVAPARNGARNTGQGNRSWRHYPRPTVQVPSGFNDNGGSTMKIVVIGGTGLIGSKTTAILRQGGHEVVAASPQSGVNTITGEGLKEAMADTQVVIDLANSPSFE